MFQVCGPCCRDFRAFRRRITATQANTHLLQTRSHLEPDGWVEMQEIMFPVSCDDGTLTKDHALSKWSDLMVEASHKIGRFMDCGSFYKQQMKDAGFENVS